MGKNLKGKELGKGLYQRKDGRYEAKAMVRGHKIDLYGWNLKELKIRLAEEKSKLESEFSCMRKDIILNDWFDEWFEIYKKPYLKESSISVIIRTYQNSFGKLLGKRKLNEILNVDIQFTVNQLKEEGKGASVMRDALGYLTQCMEMAKQNGIITRNPCSEIRVDWKTKKNLRKALSLDMEKRFLKVAEESWYREFVYTLFLTGLRMGEISGLQWKDINWKKKCIYVERTLSVDYCSGNKVMKYGSVKTVNSYRKIPFMGRLEEILRMQQIKQDQLKKVMGDRYRNKGEFSDLVFITSMGSPVTRYSAEKQINIIKQEMNMVEEKKAKDEGRLPEILDTINPYIIRHTFATRCFESGMDPKVVQQLMGHAHYSTTAEIYTHVTDSKIAEECKKFTL